MIMLKKANLMKRYTRNEILKGQERTMRLINLEVETRQRIADALKRQAERMYR